MTNFFNFDDLTWDEVANLPRDTPLVLPLGSGYDNAQLQNQLSNPERCGLLPSFPFGWRNSRIEIPEKVFMPYIINLLDSLRDDGFTNVYCLAPQGFDPQSSFMAHLSPFILRQSHASHYQAKAILPSDSERDKVILIPIGHTEQHGFHLPLSVDTIIGVNIYVLDDWRPDEDLKGYQPPTCSGCGSFHIKKKRTLPHYSDRPNVWQGTNNSVRLKNNVYSWLVAQ